MKYRVLAAIAATVFAASAAHATDLPNKKAPPAGPTAKAGSYSWTGFHVGIGGGLAMTGVEDSSSGLASYNINNGGNGSNNGQGATGPAKLADWCAKHPTNRNYERFCSAGGVPDGLFDVIGAVDGASGDARFGFGTIEAGYDQRYGNYVFGVNAAINLQSSKSSTSATSELFDYTQDPATGTGELATLDTNVTLKNSYDLTARAGYLLNERWLAYVLGGYSRANMSIESTLTSDATAGVADPNNGNPLTLTSSGWRSGYVLGAGVEGVITDTITAKLEYRYADYSSISGSAVSADCAAGDACLSLDQDVSVNVQSIRAVLGYRF